MKKPITLTISISPASIAAMLDYVEDDFIENGLATPEQIAELLNLCLAEGEVRAV